MPRLSALSATSGRMLGVARRRVTSVWLVRSTATRMQPHRVLHACQVSTGRQGVEMRSVHAFSARLVAQIWTRTARLRVMSALLESMPLLDRCCVLCVVRMAVATTIWIPLHRARLLARARNYVKSALRTPIVTQPHRAACVPLATIRREVYTTSQRSVKPVSLANMHLQPHRQPSVATA